MATEAIKTRTEGRMLFKKTGDARLADAGKMPIDQLEALIAEIKSGKAPKAAKVAASNGAKKKTTATTAVVAEAASPAKAKKVKAAPVTKAAPQDVRKRALRDKRAEAAAKATEAAKMRPAKAAKSEVVTPAQKAKATPKPEAKPVKAAKATPKAEMPKKAPRMAAAVKAEQPKIQGIARLDNASIDWTRESPVGTTGKRKQVLDLLRKFEGDKSKVFAKLESYATEFYPDKDEMAARKMLTWLIGRVAFDFASKSGQHVSGSRTWTFTPKAASRPYGGAPKKKVASPARKPASPQTPAQKATAAQKKAGKRA
jgi:hypothetical protein